MLVDEKDGPIPGENFTSDTKNYPWHQPPEFADVTKALDMLTKKMTTPKTARFLIATAQAGFPLVNIAQMIIMQGVSAGKWTIDMGLLIAGPCTKILEIMCDNYGVEFTLGIEEDESFHTGVFWKEKSSIDEAVKKGDKSFYSVVSQEMPQIQDAIDPPAEQSTGSDEGLAQQGFASTINAGAKAPPKPEKK